MTDSQLPIWIVILAWSGQFLVFAGALIGLWSSMRATHRALNSRLDEWRADTLKSLQLTATSSFAAGRLDRQNEYERDQGDRQTRITTEK